MALAAMNQILVVAANPADEVLGCSINIARHADSSDQVQVLFVAECSTSRQQKLDLTQARDELSALLQGPQTAGIIVVSASMELLALPDNCLDSLDRLDLIKRSEECVECHHQECFYVHHAGDVNMDHRRLDEPEEHLEPRRCAQSGKKSAEAFYLLRQLV